MQFLLHSAKFAISSIIVIICMVYLNLSRLVSRLHSKPPNRAPAFYISTIFFASHRRFHVLPNKQKRFKTLSKLVFVKSGKFICEFYFENNFLANEHSSSDWHLIHLIHSIKYKKN